MDGLGVPEGQAWKCQFREILTFVLNVNMLTCLFRMTDFHDVKNIFAPTGSPTLFEIEKLKVMLQAEKKKSELMEETIKGLKQDKTLLQQELTKKAELICDFLQDQLSHRPGRSDAPLSHLALS